MARWKPADKQLCGNNILLSLSMVFSSHLYKMKWYNTLTLPRWSAHHDRQSPICVYCYPSTSTFAFYTVSLPWIRPCIKWRIEHAMYPRTRVPSPIYYGASRSPLECLASVIYTGIYIYKLSLMKSKLYTIYKVRSVLHVF